MKNYLSLILISVFIFACKPVTSVEEISQLKTDISSQDTAMQQKEQTAEIRLTVPDSTWSIKIVNVTQTDGEIAILCQLTQSDMMGMMVISEVVDAISFTANKLPIKYYIKGKTWNWENPENYTFMSEESKFFIRNGEPIPFVSIEPSEKGGPKKQVIGDSF